MDTSRELVAVCGRCCCLTALRQLTVAEQHHAACLSRQVPCIVPHDQELRITSHTEPMSPDDNCKSRPERTMEHLSYNGRRYIGIDHTRSHKAAAARRLAAAQLKWSSQHHIGARVHPAFCKRVYLSRLTASDFSDRIRIAALLHNARVRQLRSGRVSSRRSTKRGTSDLRDARVNLLLRFHDSATCN